LNQGVVCLYTQHYTTINNLFNSTLIFCVTHSNVNVLDCFLKSLRLSGWNSFKITFKLTYSQNHQDSSNIERRYAWRMYTKWVHLGWKKFIYLYTLQN